MRLPGFTAETSVRNSARRYLMPALGGRGAAKGAVSMAMFGAFPIKCEPDTGICQFDFSGKADWTGYHGSGFGGYGEAGLHCKPGYGPCVADQNSSTGYSRYFRDAHCEIADDGDPCTPGKG